MPPAFVDGYSGAADLNDALLRAIASVGEVDDRVSRDHRVGLLRRGSLARTRDVTSATVCAERL